MDDLKERSPYLYDYLYEEEERLKEHYCEKCQGPMFFRACERCGHSDDPL